MLEKQNLSKQLEVFSNEKNVCRYQNSQAYTNTFCFEKMEYK